MHRGSRKIFWLWGVTLASLFMAGCAPVIAPEALKKVDQSISFERLLEDPESYRGRTVLLGGDIIETQNLPEKTLIVVLQRSLGFRKKPDADGVSKGRFIVSIPDFLDPAIYRPRRKITVAGTVTGKDVRPLGEIYYGYPVVEKTELYLWPEEEPPYTEPGVRFGIGIGIGL